MKVKEAVVQLKSLEHCGMFEVEALFGVEMFKRMKLRAHGQNMVSESLAEGVLQEMGEWIFKVCRELGWSEDACEKARQECKQTALTSTRLAIAHHNKNIQKADSV